MVYIRSFLGLFLAFQWFQPLSANVFYQTSPSIFAQCKQGLIKAVGHNYDLSAQQQKLLANALDVFKLSECFDQYGALDEQKIKMFSSRAQTVLKNSRIPDSVLLHVMPFLVNASYLNQSVYQTFTQKLYRNMVQKYPLLGVYSLFLKDPRQDNSYFESEFALDLYRLKNEKQNIMDEICQLEQNFEQQGFVTFVHARRWEWNFFNGICCLIEEVVYKKQVDPNKVILRFRNPNSCDLKQLQIWRNELVKDGIDFSSYVSSATRHNGKSSEVVYLNRSVLSNNNYYGECSATYFMENNGCSQENMAFELAKKMIEEHGLSDVIHDQMLQKLYDMHKECNQQTGELVIIAVRKDAIDTMLYPARSGGRLNGDQPASYYLDELEKSVDHDPIAIDQNRRFYCMAVPDIPGDYGVLYHTRSIALKNSQKYAAYQSAFADFKADIIERFK